MECGPGLYPRHLAACKGWGKPWWGRRSGDPRHPFPPSQKITDNIKGKVCSLAVCAVAWLVAHVRMLGLDEREKSLQMIRQLAGPLYSENTLQFYNERSAARLRLLGTLQVCREKSAPPVTSIPFSYLPKCPACLLTHFLAHSCSYSHIHSLIQQHCSVCLTQFLPCPRVQAPDS